MKIYLDTNILIFLLTNQDELSVGTKELISDYANVLQTSTVCVHELIHLCQIGKLEEGKRKRDRIRPENIQALLDRSCIRIVPVTERHLDAFASLPLYEEHRDPNDRLIIAQAIADKTLLISSDRKFSPYEHHGLTFIFNER